MHLPREKSCRTAGLSLLCLSIAGPCPMLSEPTNAAFRPTPALHPSQQTACFRHLLNTMLDTLGLCFQPLSWRPALYNLVQHYAGVPWQYLTSGPQDTLNSHSKSSLMPSGVWEPYAKLLSNVISTTKIREALTPHMATLDLPLSRQF